MTVQLQTTRVEVLTEDDARSLKAPLDSWLRPRGALLPSVDLPLLLGANAPATRYVLRERGRIVSHAGLFVHHYRSKEAELDVGIIGAVATAPEARGRGYAKRILREICDDSASRPLDLLCLWSEADALYESQGFVKAGEEHLYVLPSSLAAAPSPTFEVRLVNVSEWGEVARLHSEATEGTVRTETMWTQLLSVPATDVYGLFRKHRLVAYAVVGKGADLVKCVHEWRGPEDQMPGFLCAILGLRSDPELVVMCPAWTKTLSLHFEALGIHAVRGALGMLKIPDPERAARQFFGGRRAPDSEGTRDAQVLDLVGPSTSPPRIRFYLSGLDSM